MNPTRRTFLTRAAPAALLASSFARLDVAQSSSASSLPLAAASLKDRTHEAVPISSAEREARVARARELMTNAGIAAICMTGGTSLRYFTGVHWWNSERLMALVLPDKGLPFAVCPAFEADRLHEQFSLVPSFAATQLLTWQEDESPMIASPPVCAIARSRPDSSASKKRPRLSLRRELRAPCRGQRWPARLP